VAKLSRAPRRFPRGGARLKEPPGDPILVVGRRRKLELRLVDTRAFSSGVVVSTYVPGS
jgi:hypothetical protein